MRSARLHSNHWRLFLHTWVLCDMLAMNKCRLLSPFSNCSLENSASTTHFIPTLFLYIDKGGICDMMATVTDRDFQEHMMPRRSMFPSCNRTKFFESINDSWTPEWYTNTLQTWWETLALGQEPRLTSIVNYYILVVARFRSEFLLEWASLYRVVLEWCHGMEWS